MEDTIAKLKELLGEKEDIHSDYYYKTKSLLEEGLNFPVKLHLDNETKENILYSLFSIYRNNLQLISSDRQNKVIDDYLGKALIWENDVLEITVTQENKVVYQESLMINQLSETIRDRIIKAPQLMNYEGKDSFVKVTLVSPGFERKYNESVQYTPEHKMNYELGKVLDKLIFAHREAISVTKDPSPLALRLIHRLRLWGFDFSESNYLSSNFTEVLQKQININALHFRHTWAISQLHTLLMESLDNDTLIKEVENRLQREMDKLQSSYDYLSKFKNSK